MIKSRNQREGYYAGWRRLRITDRHQRTGIPTENNEYTPALDPLPKRHGKQRRPYPIGLVFKSKVK